MPKQLARVLPESEQKAKPRPESWWIKPEVQQDRAVFRQVADAEQRGILAGRFGRTSSTHDKGLD